MSRPETMESGLSTTVDTRVQDERRRRFEQLLVRALGDDEDEVRELTSLEPLHVTRPSPWPPPGDSSTDSPLSHTTAAREVYVRQVIQREIEQEAEARLPRRGFAPHSHQLRFPPYDLTGASPEGIIDGQTSHGGHALSDFDQAAYGSPKDGLLGIWTRIEDESSQTDSTAFLDVTIRPVLSKGSMVVTPFLTFHVYHYLESAGFGGCHADGLIGMVLSSNLPDGSNPVEEDRAEIPGLWDVRCGGFSSVGTQDLDAPPDETGMVHSMLRLTTSIDDSRIFTVRPYIRSRADADGNHGGSASHAFVSYHATLHWLEIDESW